MICLNKGVDTLKRIRVKGSGSRFKSPFSNISLSLCNASPWTSTNYFFLAQVQGKKGGEETVDKNRMMTCTIITRSTPFLPHSSLSLAFLLVLQQHLILEHALQWPYGSYPTTKSKQLPIEFK